MRALKHEQKSFPQEVLEIFLHMLKSLKNFVLKDTSKLKSTDRRTTTKSDEITTNRGATKSDVRAEDRDRMLKDLEYKAAELHYLLDATAAWLDKKKQRDNRETAKTLVEKWDYMLGATECESLLDKFSTFKKSAHTDEELVRIWFDFLKDLGLNQFVAQEEEIILSPENRKLFENGRLYKDGKQLFISKYPWGLNNELLIRGELYGEEES